LGAGIRSEPVRPGAGIGGPCPAGEYVENQVVAIEDPAVQDPVDIAQLAGGELVVENHHIGRVGIHPVVDL